MAPAVVKHRLFTLVAENDFVLAMGHSAPEEVLVLIPEARRHGVERVSELIGALLG